MVIGCIVCPGVDKCLGVRPENERDSNNHQHEVQIDFIALIVCKHNSQEGSVNLCFIILAKFRRPIQYSPLWWERVNTRRLPGELVSVTTNYE